MCYILHMKLASLKIVLNVTKRLNLFPIDVSEGEIKLFSALLSTLENFPLLNFQGSKHLHFCINSRWMSNKCAVVCKIG